MIKWTNIQRQTIIYTVVFDACNETLNNLVQRWNEDLVNRVALLSVFGTLALYIGYLSPDYRITRRTRGGKPKLYSCLSAYTTRTKTAAI